MHNIVHPFFYFQYFILFSFFLLLQALQISVRWCYCLNFADMKKIKLILWSLIILCCTFSCHTKEELPPPDGLMYFGKYKDFLLDGVLDELKKKDIVCVFKDMEGNIFSREATFEEKENQARFELHYGLAEGKYMLLYLKFVSDNENDKDGVENVGVGRMLEIVQERLTVTGTRSSNYIFGGKGTKEEPYKINCDRDLYYLQGYVNEDGGEKRFIGEYFEQTTDIDLADYSSYVNLEYGWMPIGKSETNSFQGCYDGNGHKVSGMFINRPGQSGVGLFGVLYNAVVKNLVLDGISVVGDGAVGGVAGAVRGDGEKMCVSLVSNCKISNCSSSVIKGSTGVGGIIGMTDAGTRVRIDSCSVSSNTSISCTHYGVGGILGAGVTRSAVSITNCKNNAAISGALVNLGGIVGGADTLQVISCSNYGDVTAVLSGEQNALATGGIAGGSGVANFIGAHNYGSISGYKGVGGIVGSTLVTSNDDGSNAVYNNVYIQSSHNKGKISGHMMVGGLCGEAQLAVVHSYNNGKVIATGDYAGGIIGTTSVSAIHNSNNFADVQGEINVGGIAGKVQQGTYALNLNYGNITGKNGNVGGIIGKSGNQSIIHYCGNYGTIKLEDGGTAGGIAGEIGDPREWSGWDIAEVVIGSLEIVTAAIGGTVFCTAAGVGAKGVMEVTHIVHSVAETALSLANGVTLGYSSNLLNFPHSADPAQEVAVLRQLMEDEDKAIIKQIDSLTKVSNNNIAFKASDLNLSDSTMFNLLDNRGSVIEFYRANENNHQLFNDRLNETLAERYEEVEHNKHKEELTHTIIQGVCMGLTVATLTLGIIVSGGTAAPYVVAAGAVVGLVGGANAISKAVRNYDANTLEISQCFNFGEIQVPSSADGAGIVGRMADFSLITDCINGGKYTDKELAIVDKAGGKVTLNNCLDLYGTGMRKIGDVSDADDYFSNNKIFCYDKDEEGWSNLVHNYNTIELYSFGLMSPNDVLIPETVCNVSSYEGWDFSENRLWIIPSVGSGTAFPVPYVSKMMVASSGGGH